MPRPRVRLTIGRIMAAIAGIAIVLAFWRFLVYVVVPLLWIGGYWFAVRSRYRNDIATWIFAVYPIPALLSMELMILPLALEGEPVNQVLFCVTFLPMFLLLAVGIPIALLAMVLLVLREIQKWNQERKILGMRLFAVLVVAPTAWVISWFLLQWFRESRFLFIE